LLFYPFEALHVGWNRLRNGRMTNAQQVDFPPRLSGRRMAIGAGAFGAVSILKMLLQMISLPLMARLLGPSEFGLYSIAIPVVAVVGTMSDGGLGMSLMKEPDSSPIWSTAFWALLGIGVVLALGLAGTGFGLGVALNQPRLPGIMAALSVTVILMTISVTPVARLDRQGRIAIGAAADLVGNIIGACIGIFLAFRGAGAWSLVGQYVTVYLTRAVVVNFAAFQMPKFEFQPATLRSHFATGGLIVGVRMADFAGRMVESICMGRGLGTAAVGVYAFSNQLPRFVCETFSNPLWLSMYIRALRGEKADIIALHRQFSRLLGMILFPAAALFLVTAPNLIPLFLGKRWLVATPLLPVLFLAYVMNVIGSQNGALLLAYDRYDRQLYCTIGLGIAKIAIVCLGPWIGLAGIAYGVSCVHVAYAVVMIFGSAGVTGCSPLPVIRSLIGPLAASIFSGAVAWTFLRYWGGDDILGLALCLSIGTIGYGAAIILFDRKHLVSDLTALKNLIGRRRAMPAG
jgi:O-antigen/teichoic acid export membrane protein